MEERTPVLLVTANVGSIFEDPDSMLHLWMQEFLQIIVRFNPKFIALHCQEVGGKNYETRMQHVDNFVKMLMSSDELKLYDKAEIFLDEDFSCAENFTALGNFYFIHETVKDILIWNFEDLKFQNINARNVHSGNIECVPIKEKSKFPQNFFPECKWSRKGYLRTRWSLNNTIFDLVNIHLFHDASNFIAMQSFPSVYTVTRQKALQYTLNRFYNEERSAPFFLFGDFNFRTDTRGVIKKLTHGLNEFKEADSNDDDCKVEYKDEANEVVVTIGKKEFCHSNHQNVFIYDAGEWLKEYDREMDEFQDQLFEFPVKFLPSYPFEENCLEGESYMKTRCPAWCDRVLLSVSAKQLIGGVDSDNIEYSVIGKKSCMGDHKPVYLFVNLINGAGIIQSKLPFRKLCPACKLNSSVFCDVINDPPPVGLKSHVSCSTRNDASPVILPCSSCKKHYRNPSKFFDAISPPMSTVAELSDRVSDQTTEKESYSSAMSTLTNVNSTDSLKPGADNDDHLSTFCNINPSVHDSANSKFADDNVSLHHFCESAPLKGFVSRSFDESVVNFRSNSVSAVIEDSWRCKTCVCLRDNVWRMRSISTSSHASSWTSETRMRLKSDPNLKVSLPRIRSHHSSSDEEWFEEVEEVTKDADDEKNKKLLAEAAGEIEECIEFDADSSSITHQEPSAVVPLTSQQQQHLQQPDRSRKKYFLFCIPTKWRKSNVNQKSLTPCRQKNRTYFRFLSSRDRKCRLCCFV